MEKRDKKSTLHLFHTLVGIVRSYATYGFWAMRDQERRKKERRITKLEFSCLFFSAFVWASRTLGAFLTIEYTKDFCLQQFHPTLPWLSQSCFHVGCHFEPKPLLHRKCMITCIPTKNFLICCYFCVILFLLYIYVYWID